MRKVLGIITLLLVAGLGIFIYWNFLRVDEVGVREGVIQGFSRKGQIFKTNEGELLGGGFGRVGAGFQAQYFFFSVEDPQVASFIEQNTGKNLTLHYVKYQKALPWRGENYGNKNQHPGQYIVDKAEVNNTGMPQQENRPALEEPSPAAPY